MHHPVQVPIKGTNPLLSLLDTHMHICPGHMTAVMSGINYRLVTSSQCLGSVSDPIRGGNSQVDRVLLLLLLLWVQVSTGSENSWKCVLHVTILARDLQPHLQCGGSIHFAWCHNTAAEQMPAHHPLSKTNMVSYCFVFIPKLFLFCGTPVTKTKILDIFRRVHGEMSRQTNQTVQTASTRTKLTSLLFRTRQTAINNFGAQRCTENNILPNVNKTKELTEACCLHEWSRRLFFFFYPSI